MSLQQIKLFLLPEPLPLQNSVYRLFFSNTVIFEYPYSKKYSYSDFLGPNIRDFSDIRTVEYPMFEYSIRMVESSILSLKLHSNKVVTTSFLFFCVFPVSYAVLRAMIGPNIRDFSDIRTVEYPMFEYSIRIVECSILSLKLHLNKVVTSFLFFCAFPSHCILPHATRKFYHQKSQRPAPQFWLFWEVQGNENGDVNEFGERGVSLLFTLGIARYNLWLEV